MIDFKGDIGHCDKKVHSDASSTWPVDAARTGNIGY
jgi:hypothetical protein